MNNKRNKRNYSQEFKDEAVRLLIDEGQSLEEVARKLDIQEKELQQWRNKHIRTIEVEEAIGTVLAHNITRIIPGLSKTVGFKKGLRKIRSPFIHGERCITKKDLGVQKSPGQLLPAGLGKITVNVIAQIATVRCKRSHFLLDHLVEAVDLLIQIRTGLVADHQIFKIPAQIVGV